MMFKKNTKHTQGSLFSPVFMLSEGKRKKLRESEEQLFYELIFSKIKEEDFACLYSEKESRPNAPVNAMVAALILMHRKNWTYEQLFKEIDFNLLTRAAFGLQTLDETPFCVASLFNFQNRINEYGAKNGINLFEKVFDHLTEEELKSLKLKTCIQRTDSFFAASNIRNFSRLQLLIEIVIRIYRVLDERDKERVKEKFQEYTHRSSSQYMYYLPMGDAPRKIEEIGLLYYWISKNFALKYKDVEIFKTFDMVYQQHFTVAEEKVTVVPSKELQGDMVQSPDDLDATYRKKSGKASKGQSVSITETAHPDNELNLITDVAVASNTTDDNIILNSRLDILKEKTPDLAQLHMDAAYGGPANDEKMKTLAITPVQTGIRGKIPRVPIKINPINNGVCTVECPHQSVVSEIGGQLHKACFDIRICATCADASACQTLKRKSKRVYYFTEAVYLRKQRHQYVDTIAPLYQNIRANVEATVCEFSNKLRKRKLKVRGFFKTTVFAYATAISVNFGRIFRHVANNGYFATNFNPVSLSRAFAAVFLALFHFFSFSKNLTQNVLKTCLFIAF
jgi:hypothetical protein